MSGIDNTKETLEEVQEKLDDLKSRFGFKEPDRGDMEDPDIEWRIEKPNYTKVRKGIGMSK